MEGEPEMIMQSVWFFLWGLLWALFFMTGGFDLGIGIIYNFLGKTDTDKKTMISSLGPLWDGNEVWLITAGGVTFAAFPMVYATMFSTLYVPLMLVLFALIIRGVSFEFRGLSENKAWKFIWDSSIFVGSLAPALLLGVAFANIFAGIPFDANGVFQGNLFTLLTPYGILGGLVFVLLFAMHGSLWLCVRTENELQARAVKAVSVLWPIIVLCVAGFVAYSWFATKLFDNYIKYPALYAIIVLAVAALVAARVLAAKKMYFRAWGASCAAIVFTTFFGVAGLFPNLFPSSIDPKLSLTAFNASSSPLTLRIMLIVVVIFIPVVLAYQGWAYKLFSHKIKEEDLHHDEAY